MTCQERSCSRSTWKATAVVEPLQHTYGGSRSCGWKEVGRELLEGHVQTNFGFVIVCGMKEGTYVGTSRKASVTPHCVQSARSWPLRHRLFPPVPVVYYEVVPRVDLLLEVLKRLRPLGVAASEAVAEDDANHGLVGELLRVVRWRTLAVAVVGKLQQDDHGIVHACGYHPQLSRVFRGDVENYTTQ